MFKKDQRVVKVIDIRGSKTATVQVVESVKKGVVRLVDSSLTFENETGRELDPAFMQFFCEIIPFDGGEVERLGL